MGQAGCPQGHEFPFECLLHRQLVEIEDSWDDTVHRVGFPHFHRVANRLINGIAEVYRFGIVSERELLHMMSDFYALMRICCPPPAWSNVLVQLTVPVEATVTYRLDQLNDLFDSLWSCVEGEDALADVVSEAAVAFRALYAIMFDFVEFEWDDEMGDYLPDL